MNKSIAPKGYVSRVKIQVTAENIQNACKANTNYCMIAEAIKAQLPGVRNVSVDMMHVRWSDPEKGWRYIYMTPKPAQYALIRYDMGLEIEPFSFQVRTGIATPMQLGTGKNRKRAHAVRQSKILKTSDHGTIAHSVASKSVPMHPADKETTGFKPGRPKEWHPSHNSLRHFGLRGFTEGYRPSK